MLILIHKHLWCSSRFLRLWATEVCDVWPVRRQTHGYLPSSRASPLSGRYQIILLGDRERHVCEQLAQGCYQKARGRESNPRPSESQVQRPNQYATFLMADWILWVFVCFDVFRSGFYDNDIATIRNTRIQNGWSVCRGYGAYFQKRFDQFLQF